MSRLYMNTLYKRLERIKSTVPEGKKGDWAVEKFVIDKAGAQQFNLGLLSTGITTEWLQLVSTPS